MISKIKIDVNKIVEECRKVADNHIRNWKASNNEWPTIEGAAYLRLSTDEQVVVEKGSLEQQIYLAIAEAENRSKQNRTNYRIVTFHIEPGISGQIEKRREFIQLKRDIAKGRYQFVVFKEIARVARDGILWKQFFKLCQEKNCEVVIRGLPIDPNDPASILQLDILSAFAEYEAKNTSKRIRDSVRSAMLNNGKFNSTHSILGLDSVVRNGVKQVGLYTPNYLELKTVEWLMTTFLKYGAHNKTLEECEKHGVRNKNGKPFARHSLITLLTNTKYIGKWYLNLQNKLKPQDRLPENERYEEIDLPHGCLIDMNLWNQVQKKVTELSNSSGKYKSGDNRIYPLSSGLLQHRDGTHFKGYCGNGRTQSSYYYRNVRHKINIKAPVIEQDALKVVTEIVKKGPRFQEAIKRFGGDVADHIQFLESQLSNLEGQFHQVTQDKKSYLENLGTLLKSCEGLEEIKAIKEGFKDHLDQITKKQKDLEQQIEQVKRSITESKGSRFTWNNIGDQAERILRIISENDPLALKQAYRALFSSVVIEDEDENGIRKINYVLGEACEDDCGPRLEMVEAGGIEPPSASLPLSGATFLVHVLSEVCKLP